MRHLRGLVRAARLACALSLLIACATGPEARRAGPSPSPGPVAPVTSPAASAAAPAHPRYRIVGRVDRRDPSAPRFAWPGTAVLARFQGTRLVAKLRDSGGKNRNHFQVVIDGNSTGMFALEVDKEEYVVASDLAPGEHTVALYKRTEAEVGDVTLLGLTTDGKMLAPPPAPARRIELIGDSITAGYGNEGKGPLCPFKPAQENENDAYGAMAARTLGAERVTIAWSGRTIGQLSAVYGRILPMDADSPLADASFAPQMVVVNLGTNNFAVGDPGALGWHKAYAGLVEKVRAAYPDTLIVLALGPMLTDAYPLGRKSLTKARMYMHSTYEKLRAADPKIALLEFPEQKHSDGLGCNFHPSKKTHAMMAERLVAFAKEKLGW